VDARLHHLQGKTGIVTDLLSQLQEFHREKLAALLRHEAGARLIVQYDANNTYQYIVNREEAQLSWIAKAIVELGAVPPPNASDAARSISGKGKDAVRAILEEDARDAQAFVDRWRPRIDAMANARHATMLRVVLGEVLEAKRFFEQALAGRTDLLGTRSPAAGALVGEVLPERWIE
jgi:hypothetical protein